MEFGALSYLFEIYIQKGKMRKILHNQRATIDALCIPLDLNHKNNPFTIYLTPNILSNNNLFVSPMFLDKLASQSLKIASAIAKIISIPTRDKIRLDIIIGSQKIVLAQGDIFIGKISSLPAQEFLHCYDDNSIDIIFPHVGS